MCCHEPLLGLGFRPVLQGVQRMIRPLGELLHRHVRAQHGGGRERRLGPAPPSASGRTCAQADSACSTAAAAPGSSVT